MNSNYFPRFILFMCAGAICLNAQIQFHFGVEAGVPLTDTLSSTSSSSSTPSGVSFDRYNSETKRLLIGPTFRVDLAHGLGIEFDALYQRVDYDHANLTSLPAAQLFTQSFEQTTGNRWQFPLLVQYSKSLSKAKVHVEAGPSISRIAGSHSTFSSTTSIGSTASSNTSTIAGQGGTLAGITTGAGIDLPLFHFHLRPEFRYSHWFSANVASAGILTSTPILSPVSSFIISGPISVAGGPAIPTFRTAQNEAAILVGLTF